MPLSRLICTLKGSRERDCKLEWKLCECGIYFRMQCIGSITVPIPLWVRALRPQALQETYNTPFSRSRSELSKLERYPLSTHPQIPQTATAISWPGLERLSREGLFYRRRQRM